MIEIVHSDCLEHMKTMADNSIDCIVTDPPYFIGFMGKEFDKPKDNIAASKELWAEALRVCKPGSHCLAFGADRTHHHLMVALEQAGWQIRTCLYWITGQGFPKSHNFGKQLSPEWHGYGTALKPAVEIIVMAMKPLEGNFAQNALKWGVGGLNIDETRIPIESKIGREKYANTTQKSSGIDFCGNKTESHSTPLYNFEKGRWPSNLILDEKAAAQLDQMTGHLKTGHRNRENHKQSTAFWDSSNRSKFKDYDDSGGASRFFYCAKASSSERNAGLEKDLSKNERSNLIGQNTHPCVKPIKLMEYLLKLIMPTNPNAIVLDPFLGSGSTLVAAKQLGFNAIGIEKEDEYVEIARKRVQHAKRKEEQLELSLEEITQ